MRNKNTAPGCPPIPIALNEFLEILVGRSIGFILKGDVFFFQLRFVHGTDFRRFVLVLKEMSAFVLA